MKKSRIYKIFLFILVNLTVFSNIKNDDKIRAENNNNIKIAEEKVEIINKDEDDGYIYLDRITEEAAEEKTKKESKLVKIINKIDDKINPVLNFYTPASYGSWYLIKTTNKTETEYENVRYNFKQEENGYRIIKTYYVPDRKIWMEYNERGWIQEKKGKVYLKTENKRFKSFANEIIYFDKDYKYMIIKYAADGSIRLLSKFPINKIMIEDDEKERLEEKLEKIESTKKLYDVKYDPNLKNEKEGMDFEKKIQEERAKKIEKQIIENYENFFKID